MSLKKSKSMRRVKHGADGITREASSGTFSRAQSQFTDANISLESQSIFTTAKSSGDFDNESRRAEVRLHALKLAAEGNAAEFRYSRVFLCGQGGSGKTSLLNSLTGRAFAETESTVGVNECMFESSNEGLWTEYHPAHRELERAQARMVAKKMGESAQTVPTPPVTRTRVVDMLQPKKTSQFSVGAEFASQRRRTSVVQLQPLKVDEDLVMKYLEFPDNFPQLLLSVWDFGGSEVFYTLYHLFMTRSGCYVVTFNMQALTNSAFEHTKNACLNFLHFWLSAIAMHTSRLSDGTCARIVLVGTNKDVITSVDDHERISEVLIEAFEDNPAWPSVEPFRESRLASGNGSLCFFPVSNKMGREDAVVGQLKTTIENLLNEGEYINALVPLPWLAVYDALKKETRNSISLRDLEDICGKCGLPSSSSPQVALPEEMLTMTKYLSELGITLHNNEETALRHSVVLKPATLFVRPAARMLCDFRTHFLPEHEAARRVQPHLVTRLKSKGVLGRKLLHLLCPELLDPASLERLMVKFGLIVPLLPAWAAMMDGPEPANGLSAGHAVVEEGTGGGNGASGRVVKADKEGKQADAEQEYLVPSILPELQEGDLLRGSEVMVTCYLLFAPPLKFEEWRRMGFATMSQVAREGFCPSGFFARLVGKCVAWSQCTHGWGIGDMVLGAMGARLCYGSHWFVLRSMPEFQAIRMELLVPHTHMVLGRVIEQANEVLRECMPGVDCEAAVPSDGGRRKGGYTGFQGSVMLIDAMTTADSTGSEMQVDEADSLVVMDAPTIRARFDCFLPPKEETEGYHMFLSYRWGPEDTVLAEGLYSRLSLENLRGQQLQVFRDVYRLQSGRSYRKDFLQAMISSAVVVPIISKWAIHHMLGMTADSPVDNVLLEWTLCLELLEQGRVAACFPVLLGHWLQAPSPTGAMVSPLFAPPGPVPSSLPEVTVRSVNLAAGRALKACGIEPSGALAGRTIRAVVSQLTQSQGIAAWSLPRPSTGHGRGGLAGDGGWVERAGGGSSSAHVEQEFKAKLLREAAAKCLLCLQRCVAGAAAELDEPEEHLTAGSVQALVEAVRPHRVAETHPHVPAFETQLSSLAKLPAAKDERSAAQTRAGTTSRTARDEEHAGEEAGAEEKERVWEAKDFQAEWDEVMMLKAELQTQVQRAKAEADAVEKIRQDMYLQREELQAYVERVSSELAEVVTLREMLGVQAAKMGLNRVSHHAGLEASSPGSPLRTGSGRFLGSSVDRRSATGSFGRTRTSPSKEAAPLSLKRLDSSSAIKLRSPDAKAELDLSHDSKSSPPRNPVKGLQPVALPALRGRTPSDDT